MQNLRHYNFQLSGHHSLMETMDLTRVIRASQLRVQLIPLLVIVWIKCPLGLTPLVLLHFLNETELIITPMEHIFLVQTEPSRNVLEPVCLEWHHIL